MIYLPIQYSNQVLYCCYKDPYDFNTKTSINSVNKYSCCRNYIFAELQPFGRFYNQMPCIIMYANNDAARQVFVHYAFPVFIMSKHFSLTFMDGWFKSNKGFFHTLLEMQWKCTCNCKVSVDITQLSVSHCPVLITLIPSRVLSKKHHGWGLIS